MSDGLTCKEITEFLDRYLTEGLSHDARIEFERHLAACPACVDYLDSYRKTIALAGRLGEPPQPSNDEVPEELISAILASRRHGAGPT